MKPDNYCQMAQYIRTGAPDCSGKIPDYTGGGGNIDDLVKVVGDSE